MLYRLFNLILLVFWVVGMNTNHSQKRMIRVTKENVAKVFKREISDLPDLTSLLSEGGIKSGNRYKLLGCELDITSDGCKVMLFPDEKSCKETLSLGSLTSTLMKNSDIKKVANEFAPFEVFQVQKLNLDKCRGDVEFETKAREPFNVIPEKAEIKNAKMILSFNYKDVATQANFSNLAIEIEGTIKIGDTNVPITVSKEKGQQSGRISVKTDQIKVDELLNTFNKKAKEEATSGGIDMFAKAVIKEPSFQGHRNQYGGYEIVVTGQVTGIAGFGGANLFIIIQRVVDNPLVVSIVVDVKSITPIRALSTLLKKDLNDIPLIKDFTADLAIEYSTGDILSLNDQKLNEIMAKYISKAKTISKGLKIKVIIPIKNIIEKTGSAVDLKSIPEKMFVQILIVNGKVFFTFPEDVMTDLLNILLALVPKVPEFLFEKVIKKPPAILVKKFSVDVSSEDVELQIAAPKSVILGDNLLELEKAEFVLKHKKNEAWDMKIEAVKSIAGTSMDISVSKSGEDYVFKGKINELTTSALLDSFGVATKDDSTNLEVRELSVFEKMKFLDFGVKDLAIDSTFGGQMKIQIHGKPSFFDLDATFEGVIIDKEDKERAMAFALVLENIRLDDLIKNLFDKKLVAANWMADLKAVVYFANSENISPKDFITPALRKAGQIQKGVFFNTTISLPTDCKREPMCEVIREKMNAGSQLILEGEVTEDGMTLKAGWMGDGISFGENLLLMNAVVQLSVTKEGTEFYIQGSMKFVKQKIIFKARLGLAAVGTVELSLSMEGIWFAPFNVQEVAFGNMKALVGISPAAPMPKIEMVGELHLGVIGNGKEITAKAAIGFNPLNPLDDYFYADINKFTLMSICDAFDVKTVLPDVLLNSGFPQGLIAGFTTNPNGKNIDLLKIKLDPGVQLQGQVDILGYRLQCKLIVNIPTKFELTAQMSVIDIGKGLIRLRKSTKNKEDGPYLFVSITPNEVAVKLQAYAQLLGLGAQVSIDISNKGLFFTIYGNLFSLVEANVTVSAPYGKDGDIKKVDFQVASCLSTAAVEVGREARQVLVDAADVTENTLKETQEDVEGAGSWYDRAVTKLDYWEKKMESKQAAIDRKAGKLEKIKEYLDDKCVNNCPQVCLGGFVKNKKCKKLFGKSVPCPEWDDCKTKIDDALCLAKCKGKQVYLQGKGSKKRITMEILAQQTDIIQKVLKAIREFVESAKDLIEMAEKASAKLEQAALSGKRAIDAIANYTKENLINIHSICFNTTLAEAEQACFVLNVDIVLGGTKRFKYDTKACLDISFVKNFGKAIADQLFPGISSIREVLQKAKEYFDDAKKKQEQMNAKAADVDKVEKENGEKLNSLDVPDNDNDIDDDDAQKKDGKDVKPKLIRRNATYIRHLIYGDLPNVIIRDDETIDSFNRRSPWAFSERDTPFLSKRETIASNGTVQDDLANVSDSKSSSKPRKQKFSGEVTKLPIDGMLSDVADSIASSKNCSSTKRVVDTFREISNSLFGLVSDAKQQKERYHLDARRYVKAIAEAEKDIIEKAQRANLSVDRTADALYFIQRLKNGTSRWLQNLDKQLVVLDGTLLLEWKNSFASVLGSENIDIPIFVTTLKRASIETEKRYLMPSSLVRKSPFGESLLISTKIVNDLLMSNMTALSNKAQAIDTLHNHVHHLDLALTKLNCTAEAM